MKIIITEEMRYRQRVINYAIKHNNNAKAQGDMIQADNRFKDGVRSMMEM